MLLLCFFYRSEVDIYHLFLRDSRCEEQERLPALLVPTHTLGLTTMDRASGDRDRPTKIAIAGHPRGIDYNVVTPTHQLGRKRVPAGTAAEAKTENQRKSRDISPAQTSRVVEVPLPAAGGDGAGGDGAKDEDAK